MAIRRRPRIIQTHTPGITETQRLGVITLYHKGMGPKAICRFQNISYRAARYTVKKWQEENDFMTEASEAIDIP
ncbi:hypothetical protein G6F70_007711 [Rhizopus microsporus]|uniref:Uncharacterized protein n=1 Tax=Rhizopus azygosporus TaxID=86630 RepID=A0A367K3U6_RHIAZ|nr:hypothetical protein G6F71_000943 [Rhizopus microsporus]RCH96816.1 hypothetical protein CU097_003998 [Rhizopus azygosporus]KAG1196091.1 hypothetical protein G6F70_007711 [Rhizopus microsporus]KAG1215399.1 hypothetical protein G6F69_001074 [Rhizopus microsporus]KAG1237721.1 hypothetical protein G6F67_000960 [Rhizopus microsporus]